MHLLSLLTTALHILVPILMVDAAIELALISTMVSFLHHRAGRYFDVVSSLAAATATAEAEAAAANSTSHFRLHGLPSNLLVNQGHTSNGAAGTALVLVGFGGLLVLWLQRFCRRCRRHEQKAGPATAILISSWILLTILSALLTLAALIYTFTVTRQTANQSIDLAAVAAAAAAAQNPYPLDSWTPETWFVAMLQDVPLAEASDRAKIAQQVRVMRAWRWNLVPLFVIGLLTAAAAVAEWWLWRRRCHDHHDHHHRHHHHQKSAGQEGS